VSNTLQWQCAGCRGYNDPGHVHCVVCGKQRWEGLGLSLPAADELSRVLNEEVYEPSRD
jgi:hypothetical protein